ncbi:MAG: 7-cyano-7-deazaguanine synthase QueC [Gammaproteobacteria bacterium]|nr:7-cyano-7-deazaguanine synthase QueC [Gammaproteobacteria bacterium]MDE0611262.1 7-cyano-7-deazaguanine synthase QueC [Gammaproteobacteria bacterium]
MSGDARPAVVLLSGGMDSATVLYWARAEGFVPTALSFCYGQRHSAELQAARRLAREVNCELVEMDLDLAKFGGSALTDPEIAVPEGPDDGIPVTYVPARNTVFLSIALALAEARDIHDICIGVNAIDYSGYPDCRGEFISAFEKMANLATRDGVEGHPFRIHTPLIDWTKAEIIRAGMQLGVNYAMTASCYRADSEGRACGTCEACRLRREGFEAAEVEDPTRYQEPQ